MAIAEKKRICAGIIGMVHAECPASNHGGSGAGNTVSASAGSATTLVMKVEASAHDWDILSEALSLAANAGGDGHSLAAFLLAVVVRVVGGIEREGESPRHS